MLHIHSYHVGHDCTFQLGNMALVRCLPVTAVVNLRHFWSNCSVSVISSSNNILGLSTLSFCAHFFSRTLNPLRKSLPRLFCFLSLRKHVLHFCLSLSASLIPLLTRVYTECKVLWGWRFVWWQQLPYQTDCDVQFPVLLCGKDKKLYGHVYHLQRTGPHRHTSSTPTFYIHNRHSPL